MAIGMGSIIGLGLKLVANREKIAAAWGEIAPMISRLRELYPQFKDLIDDVVPEQPKPEPESFSVEWLQESLNKLGYGPIEVDGDYGSATKNAVIEFQEANPPLAQDGWAGVATQAEIHEALAKKG